MSRCPPSISRACNFATRVWLFERDYYFERRGGEEKGTSVYLAAASPKVKASRISRTLYRILSVASSSFCFSPSLCLIRLEYLTASRRNLGGWPRGRGKMGEKAEEKDDAQNRKARERVGRSPESFFFFRRRMLEVAKLADEARGIYRYRQGSRMRFTSSLVKDVRHFFSHRSTLRRAPSSLCCCVLQIARWRLAATATIVAWLSWHPLAYIARSRLYKCSVYSAGLIDIDSSVD